MILNVKYFGHIAEITKCHEETFDFSGLSFYELLDLICDKYPDLKSVDFQIAKNREIFYGDFTISGEEIALLPPFSGG